MSQPSGTIPLRTRLAVQMRQASPAAIWGGILLSLVLHASLVAFLLWRMRPLGDGTAGEKGNEQFHAIGIVQKVPPSKQPEKNSQQNHTASNSDVRNRFSSQASQASPQSEVPKKPPIGVGSTKFSKKTPGPGTKIPTPIPGANPGPVVPGKIGLPPTPGAKRPGDGSTSFFKIRDKGKRIVYLLDGSGSMFGRPIAEAKNQLIGSLNSLNETQRFQIIFYNDATHPVDVNSRGPDPLAPASLNYIQKAKLKLDSVLGRGGTNHLNALLEALDRKHSPDVIFFLTDANNGLDRADLESIRRANRSGARIHCIQFGKGDDLSQGNNFMKKLAAMNRGRFRYVDISRFSQGSSQE
ncbi:MAG: hypothetical protein Tsb009_02210 [Planctomycetaceae bacterium]